MNDPEYRPPRSWGLFGGIAAVVMITLFAGFLVTARPTTTRLSHASVEDLQVEAAKHPKDADVAVYYAHALKETGDIDGAYAVMKRVVQEHPDSTAYIARMAQYAAILGHANETIGLYHRILSIDPRNADAHSELGHIYADAGLLTDAVHEYDTAKQLNAKVWVDPSIYAKCLAHAGRDEEAWNQLTYYFAHQPRMDEPYDTLTDIGIRLKRYDETERLLLRRISLESEYNVNRFQYDVARVILARSRGPNALKDAATFADAGAYSRMGRYDLIPDEPTPNEGKWFAFYASLLRRMGRLDEAQTTLTDGLYLDPMNPECLQELADLCASRGDPKAAFWRKTYVAATGENNVVATLNREIAAHPSDPKPLLAMATYLEKQEIYGDAAELCIRAVALAQNDTNARTQLERCRALAISKLEKDATE